MKGQNIFGPSPPCCFMMRSKISSRRSFRSAPWLVRSTDSIHHVESNRVVLRFSGVWGFQMIGSQDSSSTLSCPALRPATPKPSRIPPRWSGLHRKGCGMCRTKHNLVGSCSWWRIRHAIQHNQNNSFHSTKESEDHP